MIYATSDLHGYPLDAFRRLLDAAGFGASDTLYVLGDVIDRNGDGGVAMLRWMMGYRRRQRRFSHAPPPGRFQAVLCLIFLLSQARGFIPNRVMSRDVPPAFRKSRRR